MPHFQRVHGDYTLDDPLDPELTAHQQLPKMSELVPRDEQLPKKRHVEAVSADSGTAQFKKSQDLHDPSQELPGVQQTDVDAPSRKQHVEKHPQEFKLTESLKLSASLNRHITLKAFELYMTNDKSELYWSTKLQKHISIRKRLVNVNNVEGLNALACDLVQMMVFTASRYSPKKVFRVIPKSLFQAVIVDEELEGWLNKSWFHR
ncbi:hypothetical protein DL98DRAFT_92948 [Cadophora sp. DSE1049]|nr:hypothetical protein DL98DRAFT_92948 [Cadophora sp. DSE1049]